MAGAGYKLFNTGDVLTAAQVNTYLQEQTVMVFASSAARTSALSGVLAEGMVSYLQDTNAVEVYNGSAWVGISADQTPLTTKGDLFTFSTVDARLGVGANGTVLTADSAETTGLKWATPAAGSTVKVNYVNPSGDFTSSSASAVDITGYTITFTPTSATNKIIIAYNLNGIRSATDSIRIVVDIGGTTESLRGHFGNSSYEWAYSGYFVMTNMAATSTTVKLRVNPGGTSTTFYGSSSGFKGQNLTVMEIY